MNNHEPITSVGIIGLGSFGKFVTSLIPSHLNVISHDTSPERAVAGITNASLAAVCAADVVVLAVPLGAYPTMLAAIGSKVSPATLIIDVCSVKMKPEQLFAQHLPNHQNILMTHPLFGPQSAANGTAGHTLIVTNQHGPRADHVLQFCKHQLGLTIHTMSSREHDQTMASVHALTLFTARALANLPLQTTPFKTPSYQMLTDLVALDKSHSAELFDTIELGNPFAGAMRARLRQQVDELDDLLSTRELP